MKELGHKKIRGMAAGIGVLLIVCFFYQGAWAANFDIQPVRIVFDEKVRLEKLTVRNISDVDFPIQIKAYEWSQNAKGEDVYTETKDIITFPKILAIKTGEEKIIRIGTNVPPGAKEKTYRIYVEEMPLPQAEQERNGAKINLFLKIGIPVFIKPTQFDNRAEIEDVGMSQGVLKVKVNNKGNNHFMVTGIHIKGENRKDDRDTFNRDIAGWYLLSGTAKVYETTIPQEVCGAIDHLSILLKTNNTTVRKDVPVEGAMCSQVAEAAPGAEGRALAQFGSGHGR